MTEGKEEGNGLSEGLIGRRKSRTTEGEYRNKKEKMTNKEHLS